MTDSDSAEQQGGFKAGLGFAERKPTSAGDHKQRNLDSLLDIRIPVAVEVGSAQMPLQTILDLVPGSVVPLDKRVDELMDQRVNGKLVARGEIVSVEGNYALRVTEIVDPEGRLDSLR